MKDFYKSKEFWVAVIGIVIGSLNMAKDIIPVNVWPYIVLAIGVFTLIARSISGNEVLKFGNKKDGTPRTFNK